MDTIGISIIIPAYNEAGAIGRVVTALRAAVGDGQVIVVDDGSSDDTAGRAAAAGAEVISHPVNMGNGAAVKTGLRAAGGDLLVIMDGDGQHDPVEIPKLLAGLDDYDMVVGERSKKQHASWPRSLMNGVFNRLASYVTSYGVHDLTSGFRAMRADTAKDLLPLLPNGYSWPTTSTLVLLRSGRCVKYVPIEVQQRQDGRSRIRPIYDSTRFLMIILKICTLYSPFRIFLPVAGGLFLAGLANYGYTFLTSGRFTNMSALMFTAAIIIFMMGLLSEQISQISLLRRQVKKPADTVTRPLTKQHMDDHKN